MTDSSIHLQDPHGSGQAFADEKMSQVRELLFGEYRRETETRVALLEARIRELEQGINHRLDLLQARLDAVAGELSSERRAAFDDLARSVLELGDRIRQANRS